MQKPIFDDEEGCARTLRSKCQQPSLNDNKLDNIEGSKVYTAVIEIYEQKTMENEIIIVGMLPWCNSPIRARVLSPQGICFTIDTCNGGDRQPKIIEIYEIHDTE